jgi:hypothetical protein|tara:strand:+ start:41 stop:559 length:519 start_codon:yes stop_codon:yes gene_type:complete
MSGFVKAGFSFLKNLGKGQKTTGTEVIDKFKPGTEFKGTPKYTKQMIQARSEVQKKFKPINEGIANETRQLRQTLQGMRGERITQSGISKGKDVSPGIYSPKKKIEKKAKGGRVGLKFGSKKSNVQKIKETFGPGKSNPKKSAAKKKKFPDLTGDGKVTFADILKGRGVKRG